MARVTTEECVTSIPNRFQLVIYACRRARDLSSGNEANVEIDNDKNTVIALREIAEKKLDLMKIWDGVVTSTQKYQPVEDTDINDDQAIPLNENASSISFDNFEKENAAEKKRKKIYLTQNEIQKLIDKKKDDDNFEPNLDENSVEISEEGKKNLSVEDQT
ncbi:MAG: DNA-directed RNA polymerase subunit omega [Alphaproteobacteria bacterium]